MDPQDASAGTDPNKEARNTIDSVAPSTSVAPLPASFVFPSFPVAWSGTDDAAGSGFAAFDIFVSTNGGAWQPWLVGTTATTAVFQGVAGSRCA